MKGERDREDMRKTREDMTKGVMSSLARMLPWSFESQVSWLEDIRREGNTMFTNRDWAAAVSKYSECINLAGGQLDITGVHDKSMQDNYNRVLILAYSNRADSSLRLLEYEDALSDADIALQIDSKHAKTLVRKGKAAHGLGFFEKACKAFKCALAESPEEQSILKLLRVSSVAHEQSLTGDYDLLDFFSRDCTGDIPSCADFVGPVEIRRASDGHGRLGLFATRSVELGDLLLVSNPLAVARHKTLNADGTALPSLSYRSEGLLEKLCEELVDRVGRSTLETARLYSLARKGDQQVEIPSMELFRPGSESILPDAGDLEVDVDLICNIANGNVFEFMDLTGPESEKDVHTGVMGLWVLPAFAKHSCAPNCQHSFVGDTIFFRASGRIMEGEELTMQYFTDLFQDTDRRRALHINWRLTCNCERYLFEKSVHPQYLKLKNTMEDIVEEAEIIAESPHVRDRKREQSFLKELTKAPDEVEAVIRSLGTSLSPIQKGWIRAAFILLYLEAFISLYYFDKSPSLDHELEFESFVLFLRTVLDALTSVYVTPRALEMIDILSVQLDQTSFKHTQFYKDSRDQVLSVYKRVFGKQPDLVLYNLMKQRT